MSKKMAMRDRQEKYFSSAGLVTLKADQVPPGRSHCIQHVSWEISKALGGGNLRARLYIEGHGYKHLLREQNTPQANISYTFRKDIWLMPGEELALDLDQVAAATTAKMHLTGYWQNEFAEVV